MTAEATPELRRVLRQLKLSPVLETLPERLTLARQHQLPHAEFLELVLADEVARRERSAAQRRARVAGLDPSMTLERWDPEAPVRYDRALWAELCTLGFLDRAAGVLLVGPVGVGKTHLASALGHVAVRRRRSVLYLRADQLLKRFRAGRLDASYEQEMRRASSVDLLILDDFCLRPLNDVETQDVYELVVERYQRASTVITSNREPAEWLTAMADPLLAQSAVDRLLGSAYQLVVEGESYRQRQRPGRTP